MSNQKSNILFLKPNPRTLKSFLFYNAVVLCLFASSSMVNAASWSNWVNVDQVYAHESGTIYVKYTEMHNPDSCPNTSFIEVPASNVSGDRIYSTLLNSVATGQKVLYYIDGCSDYPKMTRIRIGPPE